MANTIYGPSTNPVLSEASAYAYAVARLHERVTRAATPPHDAWDFGSWAECDLHHYVSWALRAWDQLGAALVAETEAAARMGSATWRDGVAS